MTLVHVVVVKSIKNVMVPMNKKYFTYCFLLFALNSFSQEGSVVFKESETLKQELNNRRFTHDSIKKKGFRIQIFFGNDLSKANYAQQKFKNLFPEISAEVYKKYESPNYKIRVGNFIREIDAQKLLNELKKHFSPIFVVKDEIEEIAKIQVDD